MAEGLGYLAMAAAPAVIYGWITWKVLERWPRIAVFTVPVVVGLVYYLAFARDMEWLPFYPIILLFGLILVMFFVWSFLAPVGAAIGIFVARDEPWWKRLGWVVGSVFLALIAFLVLKDPIETGGWRDTAAFVVPWMDL